MSTQARGNLSAVENMQAGRLKIIGEPPLPWIAPLAVRQTHGILLALTLGMPPRLRRLRLRLNLRLRLHLCPAAGLTHFQYCKVPISPILQSSNIANLLYCTFSNIANLGYLLLRLRLRLRRLLRRLLRSLLLRLLRCRLYRQISNVANIPKIPILQIFQNFQYCKFS